MKHTIAAQRANGIRKKEYPPKWICFESYANFNVDCTLDSPVGCIIHDGSPSVGVK